MKYCILDSDDMPPAIILIGDYGLAPPIPFLTGSVDARLTRSIGAEISRLALWLIWANFFSGRILRALPSGPFSIFVLARLWLLALMFCSCLISWRYVSAYTLALIGRP